MLLQLEHPSAEGQVDGGVDEPVLLIRHPEPKVVLGYVQLERRAGDDRGRHNLSDGDTLARERAALIVVVDEAVKAGLIGEAEAHPDLHGVLGGPLQVRAGVVERVLLDLAPGGDPEGQPAARLQVQRGDVDLDRCRTVREVDQLIGCEVDLAVTLVGEGRHQVVVADVDGVHQLRHRVGGRRPCVGAVSGMAGGAGIARRSGCALVDRYVPGAVGAERLGRAWSTEPVEGETCGRGDRKTQGEDKNSRQ